MSGSRRHIFAPAKMPRRGRENFLRRQKIICDHKYTRTAAGFLV